MSASTNLWNPYQLIPARQRRVLAVVSVLAVLALWSLLSGTGLVAPNKLPPPWAVARAFVYLSWNSTTHESALASAALWSVGRIVVATFFVMLIGLPIGILMGAAPRINAVLAPLIDPFRSAPVVALLPIMVAWFGIGEQMKVTFLFVGSVIYLIPMVRDAIQAVPQSYWISAQDIGGTPFECVRHAVLPIAMPRIADGMIVSISVMWTYITVAEYINADQGLGQMIATARRLSAMDQVFVGIIVIIAFALLSIQLLTYAKRRFFPWETQQ